MVAVERGKEKGEGVGGGDFVRVWWLVCMRRDEGETRGLRL